MAFLFSFLKTYFVKKETNFSNPLNIQFPFNLPSDVVGGSICSLRSYFIADFRIGILSYLRVKDARSLIFVCKSSKAIVMNKYFLHKDMTLLHCLKNDNSLFSDSENKWVSLSTLLTLLKPLFKESMNK